MTNEQIQTWIMAIALVFQISMQTDTRPVAPENPQNIVVSVTVVAEIEPFLREKSDKKVAKKEEIQANVRP